MPQIDNDKIFLTPHDLEKVGQALIKLKLSDFEFQQLKEYFEIYLQHLKFYYHQDRIRLDAHTYLKEKTKAKRALVALQELQSQLEQIDVHVRYGLSNYALQGNADLLTIPFREVYLERLDEALEGFIDSTFSKEPSASLVMRDSVLFNLAGDLMHLFTGDRKKTKEALKSFINLSPKALTERQAHTVIANVFKKIDCNSGNKK
jgi:hypothetical protein